MTKLIADPLPSLVIESRQEAGQKPANSRAIRDGYFINRAPDGAAEGDLPDPLDDARPTRQGLHSGRVLRAIWEDGYRKVDLRTTESLSQFINGERPDARPRCNCFKPLATTPAES